MILAGYPCGHGWMYVYTCTVYIVLGGGSVIFLKDTFVGSVIFLKD
jgi:hypothetical protein